MPRTLLSQVNPLATPLAPRSTHWIRIRKDLFWMVVVANVVLLLVILVFRTYRFAGGNPRSPIWQTAALEKLFLVATAIGSFCRLVVSLRKRDPGAWLFFWPVMLYPAVFYITFPNVRYRQAIEAYTVMPGVFLIAEAANKGK